MKPALTTLLFMYFLFAGAQDSAYKIVKEYSRGTGPTSINDGLGWLNTKTHYDREGRVIKLIRYGSHGYMSSEITTSYHHDDKPATITNVNYPSGSWPGTVPLTSMSVDHPDRRSDTTFKRFFYEDTLLIKTDYYSKGKMSSWIEYTYNEEGYEIELVGFRKTRDNRGRWVKTTRDDQNRPIKIEELNPDSSVKYAESITYNSKGLIKSKDYQSSYLTYHTLTKYNYNSQGLKIKETTEVLSPEDRKSKRTRLFEYNSKGLLAKEGGLDSLGKEIWEQEHYYNSSGLKIRTEFEEFTRRYTYNQFEDLTLIEYEDRRRQLESTKRFIYKKGLLIKTEHYNRADSLNYFTLNFYSKSGKLIRQEPMMAKGMKALDWIKYFYYNDQGQLVRMKHKHPKQWNHLTLQTTIYVEGKQAPQTKPDPYENYTDTYTYYTYDKQGRRLNEYQQGGVLTRITKIFDDNYGIMQYNNDPHGMPSTSFQMIGRLDTLSIKKIGGTSVITLSLNYTKQNHYNTNYEDPHHYHQNLIRVETLDSKGALIALKETTEDGIVLFNYDGKTTKSLFNRSAYGHKRLDLIHFGRYTLDTTSTTLYNSDSLEYKVITPRSDTTEFHYKEGQLHSKSRQYGSGYYDLKVFDYDKKGFKTMERTFKKDGTENGRLLFENDGKLIISEQRVYERAERETVFVVTYP